MTLVDLVKRLERAYPRGGYLINTSVKRSRMMDKPEVSYEAWLYLPGKTLRVDAATLEEVWVRFRADVSRAPFQVDLSTLEAGGLAKAVNA